MGKLTSKFFHLIGRIIKGVIACALIPPLVALIASIRQDLGSFYASGKSLAGWIDLGAISYIGMHLLLYKPVTLFKIQHQALSRIATWLFGSQVSTSGSGNKDDSKHKDKGKKGKDKQDSGAGGGSTLLVLSPYLVPLYSILFCLGIWIAKRWTDVLWIDAFAASIIGASLAMHWVMTADDLQQKRDRFTLEAYVISLCIIGIISSLLVCASMPLVVSSFSVPAVLSRTIQISSDIYVWFVQGVFL
jgi:hypothetical protein